MRKMRGGVEIRANYKIFASVSAGIAVLDQLTKLAVMRSLHPYEAVEVVPGFFNIVYYLNKGAAFGILNQGGSLRKLFLIGVSLAALVLLAVLVRQSKDRLSLLAFSLVAGGAIGNLVDRIRFGSVVDFLDFHVASWHWPAFNVADSAITVGVGLVIFSYFFSRHE
ncbi:MAG: signal peptidase II [Thermodesulfobacteriota bacterium]|nr:MAG: signal peptidase II [Thermodesulfobacteriota bacterium]